MTRRKQAAGFTLMELLITMVILAIVLAIAAPSFSVLLKNNRAATLGEELSGAIQYARAEAVKRARYVSVCASSDGSSCSNDWSQGFIVVADTAANETENSVTVGEVLRVWQNLGSDVVITPPANVSFLRFMPGGRLAQVGAPPFSFQTRIDGCQGSDRARTVTVGLAGASSVTRADCS
ncbi:GspH/FimT family pseudopilin [Cellvibrio polysaccharolyticus]|nr:GspH/FimT family pseudopilin [Cellvibrio polysaccharolyticus]